MKKINEDFECVACGKIINKADKTCRNHCPYCFVSLHVDREIPGDRASSCGGKMYPIAYEQRNGVFRILFSCNVCSKQHRNKRANDDEIALLPELIIQYRSMILGEM